ncbi:acyl carrier protein [Lentzea flaviverrucosa]|uniref:acyl carrier protein n=1 Tax=Lentzea flaviverrucosa TaxID=200379 RepID=UPI00147722F6|nr:acyl carrier protein [Lentzea flaviverrucosa]
MPPKADLTETTEIIVEIFRELLKRDDVDHDSSLADLGATSLTAVRIRSRIRSRLGKSIELMDIMENLRPRELAVVTAGAPEWLGKRR